MVLNYPHKALLRRSACGSELMRFIPTRLCRYRAKTRIHNAGIVDWAAAMKPASTHILPEHTHVTIHHVMPREKRCGALDSCFGLVGPHQQSIPQLLSLASRVYKGKVELSTCGFELMRFTCTVHSYINVEHCAASC